MYGYQLVQHVNQICKAIVSTERKAKFMRLLLTPAFILLENAGPNISEQQRRDLRIHLGVPAELTEIQGGSNYYWHEGRLICHSGCALIAHEFAHSTSLFARLFGERLWWTSYKVGKVALGCLPRLVSAASASHQFLQANRGKTSLITRGLGIIAKGAGIFTIPVLLEELQASIRGGYAVWCKLGWRAALGFSLQASACFVSYLLPLLQMKDVTF